MGNRRQVLRNNKNKPERNLRSIPGLTIRRARPLSTPPTIPIPASSVRVCLETT